MGTRGWRYCVVVAFVFGALGALAADRALGDKPYSPSRKAWAEVYLNVQMGELAGLKPSCLPESGPTFVVKCTIDGPKSASAEALEAVRRRIDVASARLKVAPEFRELTVLVESELH